MDRETTGGLLRGPLLKQRAPQDEVVCWDDLLWHKHPLENPIKQALGGFRNDGHGFCGLKPATRHED